MPETILDGKGTGNMAEVTSNHMLSTKALGVPHMHYHSAEKQNAYSIHMHFSQDTGSAWEIVGYITNDGDDNLIISKAIACNEGVATDDYYGFAFYLNPTGLSGGATLTPVNMNLTSSKTLDATVKHNDDGTALSDSADGTHFLCFRLQPSSMASIDFQDAVVLGSGDTLMVKGHAKTAGEKLRITFFTFSE